MEGPLSLSLISINITLSEPAATPNYIFDSYNFEQEHSKQKLQHCLFTRRQTQVARSSAKPLSTADAMPSCHQNLLNLTQNIAQYHGGAYIISI
mmetsp:Transcript_18900/g.39810  ORF Transcript_18900/g.39810 Transcript_18900/m.39810 type:complete len:94 (+) Transcript_18900:343-624(+)